VARRVLITGISRFWGTRLALALARDQSVELIAGIDTREPTVALDRTEFVRADIRHSLIGRLIRSREIDTVVDTHLLVDTSIVGARLAHETNVIGMVNLLAGCGGRDTPVRRLIVKSSASYYGTWPMGPSVLREDQRPKTPVTDPFVADVVEMEEMTSDFAIRNPAIGVTILRFVNVLGRRLQTPLARYLSRPVVPTVLGFDPLLQFIDEHDAVESLHRATLGDQSGAFNITGCGCVTLTQMLLRAGRVNAPVMSPFGTRLAGMTVNAAGARLPLHLYDLLKDGRVVDDARMRHVLGFTPSLTTPEAVSAWAARVREGASAPGTPGHEQYEPAIEEVLGGTRRSPRVAVIED
jgi:UDP-glucose 4-epimerase